MKADDIGFQKYFHIPGQDLVLRWVEPGNANALEGRESTQAKCTSDAARHSGKRRNSNECFGGTGWRYNVDEMKWMMDWMFVRGVNLLLPHAFYYSVRGQRYNERPPDVGPNNLWWPHYRMISNYIKRMCWLMTDSVNQAEVAVICEKDYMSWRIAKPFFLNQIEFNYLEDSMFLSDECRLDGNFLVMRKQRYSIIVIEDSFPIKGAFMKKLEKFIQNGGRVVLYKTDGMARFESDYGIIETGSDEMLVEVIERLCSRTVKLLPFNPDLRVSFIKKGGVDFYLLVNEGEKTIVGKLILPYCGKIEAWDPWRCKITHVKGEKIHTEQKNMAWIPLILDRRESIIIAVYSDEHGEEEFCAIEDVYDFFEPGYKDTLKINFSTNWTVEGSPVDIGATEAFKSWPQIKELEWYSGTVSYSNTFTVDKLLETCKINLCCGEVHDFVQVYVNSVDAGIKFWKPFMFDITHQVKEGENRIAIHVTNSLANRYGRETRLSGLIGPVEIYLQMRD